MKTTRLLLLVCLLFARTSVRAQVSTWAQGFDKSVNAASARAYLGIGTNGTSGVSIFSADPLAGLFGVTVTTPTTTPHLAFSFQSQSPNLVFASPNGSSGPPSFRSLVAADLPPVGGGTVTSFASGSLSPLFTTLVATPTTTPTLSYTLTSQSQNAVFAGPTSGSGLPTFRTLVAGDIPTLSQYLLSLTNASLNIPPNFSLISASNPPIASVKSISAGGNVTITDQGTNLQISAANSGGGASGIDFSQINQTPFDGATNYYVDFSYPAQVFNPTGAIYFNYATNWGLANTSRVAHIIVPATNYYRHVYYVNTATNWHQSNQSINQLITGIPTGYGANFYLQVYGQGDSNVVLSARVDDYPISTNYTLTSLGFNPTNSQGGCVLWLEGSNGKYSEEITNVTPAPFGTPVRWWNDLSLFVPRMTNNGSSTALINANPNVVPGNIPSVNWTPGNAWVTSPTFSALAQPNWCFIAWYGRPGQFTFLDGNAEGNRFGCVLGEGPVTPQIYSGTSMNGLTPQSPVYEWRIFSFCQNSTSSIIRTNGVLDVQGNSGTQTPTRWIVGADYNGATFVGFGYLAELVVYHTNLTLVQITNVENYLKFKYGVKVP